MSKFWKIVIAVVSGLVIVAVALFVLTMMSPTLNQFAKSLAASKDWPIWLAGIMAPIIWAFNRISGFVKNLFPSGSLAGETEQIKQERDRLRKDVDALLDWRNEALKREYTEITRLQNDVADLRARIAGVDGDIKATQAASPESFTAGKDDHEVSAEYMQSLRDRGIAVEN